MSLELSGPGHDLAGRALGWPCEQRHNVLPHPRPADLGLDPFLRLNIGECENEDRVGLIDLDETGVSPPASTTARTASCADSITDAGIGSANVK